MVTLSGNGFVHTSLTTLRVNTWHADDARFRGCVQTSAIGERRIVRCNWKRPNVFAHETHCYRPWARWLTEQRRCVLTPSSTEQALASPGCVFVIEDDHDVRVALRNILEEEGYRVVSVTDGRRALEALQRMRRQPPDLILLDLMLPVMDGWEFAGHVRSIDGLSHVPIAVISAFEREPPDGIVEYLRKPLKPEALLRLVARHCHRQ